MKYYLSKLITGNFDDVVELVTEELKKEGFGVLVEIDMQKTLKDKIDVDFRKYKILEACNPPFAYKSLQTEDKIGIFLPCNIVVQQNSKTEVEVAFVNPNVAMQNLDNEEMKSIAKEITLKLTKVKDSL